MIPTHPSCNWSLNWLSYTSSQCPRRVNNMYQELHLNCCPDRSTGMRPWAHSTAVSMLSTCGLTSWGSRDNLAVGQHWLPVSSSCCWCRANGPPENTSHQAQAWLFADSLKSFRQVTRVQIFAHSLWVCIFQQCCGMWVYGSSEDAYCELLRFDNVFQQSSPSKNGSTN